ncbi:Fe(3+)-hydroxamate ABC transporter permease FhuB [Allomesorhizobium camelthorni]|nr:Fe(3+)-hydroxamate ABC transporter permease FhuB [Mesorhizobium camelthorni]
MSIMQFTADHRARFMGSGWMLAALVGVPAVLAAYLTVSGLLRLLPADMWSQALGVTDFADPRQLLYRHAFLPRLAISLLAGAALGLAGTLLQQVLRNPLAEPTTIGTNAGATVALTVATLYAPWTLEQGREWVALAGGALSTLMVLALAQGRSFSPVAIIISGLVVSLTCSSASALLMAANREYSEELFIWQSGSLIQNGDAVAFEFAPWLMAAGIAAFLLLRPLRLLDLSDEGAASLGTKPVVTRLAGMTVAVTLSSMVVAAVGVISFVALAAPALVRLAGARTLRQRMIWAPLAGASLLWLTDRLVQVMPFPSEIPAGVATAFLGAPLLFLLLPKLRTIPDRDGAMLSSVRRRSGWAYLLPGLVAMALVLCAALVVGRGAAGWHVASASELADLLPLRAPRVAVALSAGMMLGVVGMLMQRMTGNPMAAPEVLGISGGASLGILLLFVATSDVNRPVMIAAGLVGALVSLAMISQTGRRQALAHDRLLLTGVAVATMASAFSAVMLASGDPRLDTLIAWLSGSTYRATAADAIIAAVTATVLLAIMPLTIRWLEILPLGEAASRGLGLGLDRVRIVLLVLASVPTTIATLVIGPLSFVGLMAPHMARMLGFQRALPQLFGSAILGGMILVSADWAGRMLIFPWQIPAGLLAALVGGPYFMVLMWQRRR